MLIIPITTVNSVTQTKRAKTTRTSGLKGISKLKTANPHEDKSAISIPAREDNAPKKKYSNAVIIRICLLLAPNVLNRTLSCIR